jgi:hypothetical protein
MSNVTVREMSGKATMDFIKYSWKIYMNDPNWVPPLIMERKEFLDPKKNPFFKHADVCCFGAYRNNDMVGRIAAIVNHKHNTFHQDKTGFFGLFESVNDPEVAGALFRHAENYLKERGMTHIQGPASFSSNDEYGLLVQGFDSPPVIMMTYNPKYYIDLIENNGFLKAKDLYALEVDDKQGVPERLTRSTELILKRSNVTIRQFRKNKFWEEIEILKGLYNAAWEKNWGFVPMTDEEFYHLAKTMKSVVDPDIIFFAEHQGKPIGFSLSLPDINQALIRVRNGRLFPFGLLKLLWYTRPGKIHRIRVITFGILKEFRNLGIDVALNYHNFVDGMKKGYHWAEMSWVLEDNIAIVRPIERLGGRVYKTYRIYEKSIV